MDRFSFIWLSLNGRIGRLTWFLFALLLAVLGAIAGLLIRRAFHMSDPVSSAESPFLEAYFGGRADLLTELIFLWPSLAIDIKRWHDLGRSGWMTLIVYVPAFALCVLAVTGAGGTVAHPDPRVAGFVYLFALVVIVYLIVMAARKGSPATNRFGPPPS